MGWNDGWCFAFHVSVDELGFYGITWYLWMILILDHLVYDVLWRLVIEVILILDHLVFIDTTWYLWRWYWCHNIHFVCSNHVKNMLVKNWIPSPIFGVRIQKSLKRNHRGPPKIGQNYIYTYIPILPWWIEKFISFPIWRLWNIYLKNLPQPFRTMKWTSFPPLICSY